MTVKKYLVSGVWRTGVPQRMRRKKSVVIQNDAPATSQQPPNSEILRTALEEIRDHWANQYDHPRKDNEMYRGSYGIGVTDGHRACSIIAEKALALSSRDRGGQ